MCVSAKCQTQRNHLPHLSAAFPWGRFRSPRVPVSFSPAAAASTSRRGRSRARHSPPPRLPPACLGAPLAAAVGTSSSIRASLCVPVPDCASLTLSLSVCVGLCSSSSSSLCFSLSHTLTLAQTLTSTAAAAAALDLATAADLFFSFCHLQQKQQR